MRCTNGGRNPCMGSIAPSTNEEELSTYSQRFAFIVGCDCSGVNYAWSEYARDGASFRLPRNADGSCPSG